MAFVWFRRRLVFVSVLIVGTAVPAAAASFEQRKPSDGVTVEATDGSTTASLAALPQRLAYGRMPLRFEANEGQSSPDVQFLSRGSHAALLLTPNEVALAISPPTGKPGDPGRPAKRDGAMLRMRFVGANPAPTVVGRDRLPGTVNYYVGNDPARWRTNVPTYARVEYENLYPGVNAVFYGTERQLEYDLAISPGVDLSTIALGFGGVRRVRIAGNGDLLLRTSAGTIREHKPRVYQDVDGSRRSVEGHYVRTGADRIGFAVAEYDSTKTLIIDPVLSYAVYLGGTGTDSGNGIAVDANGSAYIVGQTNSAASTTFPNTGRPYAGGQDAFVTKLGVTGTTVVYSTYLGGANTDQGYGIALDATGAAYVIGTTNSSNFPSTVGNPYGGSEDAFVAKLQPDGTLAYSTYVGRSGNEFGFGIAVDGSGAVYATGETSSADFPSPLASYHGGSYDAFVVKLDSTGARSYFTYLGGSGQDEGAAIARDASGAIYVVGDTDSSNFPTTLRPYAGGGDAFVAKLNATGTIVYATLLGGSQSEAAASVAVDASGAAYVTGYTVSPNFPVSPSLGAADTQCGVDGTCLCSPSSLTCPSGNVGSDGFVTKLDPSGNIAYSTYLGGGDLDFARGIAVDPSGIAYVVGTTYSPDFPTTPGAYDTSFAGNNTDLFLTVLNATGTQFTYSTFLGGNGFDGSIFEAAGVALDTNGAVYMVSSTTSTDFTSPRPYGGSGDALVAKFACFNNCDDQDPCSLDACNATLGCIHNRGTDETGTGKFSVQLDQIAITFTCLNQTTQVGTQLSMRGKCSAAGPPAIALDVSASGSINPSTGAVTLTGPLCTLDGTTSSSGTIQGTSSSNHTVFNGTLICSNGVTGTVTGCRDLNADGVCNAADALCPSAICDSDGDGICTAKDNCPTAYNPDQRNTDGCPNAPNNVCTNPIDGSEGGDRCDACPALVGNPAGCLAATATVGPGRCDGGSLIGNANCTGPGTPFVCCSGSTTGTCPDGCALVLGAPGNQMSVTIPPGAFPNDTSVSLTQLSTLPADNQYIKLGNDAKPVVVGKFLPAGAMFGANPATIQFQWTDATDNCEEDSQKINEIKALKLYLDGSALTTECNAGGNQTTCVPAACGPSACVSAACVSACCRPRATDTPRNSWTAQVSHFSEYALGATCTDAGPTKLVVKRLDTPPGDDQLHAKTSFTRPPAAPSLDPVANGLEVLLGGADGPVAVATLAPGAYDPATRVGWKRNGAGTTWTYLNQATPPAGVYKATVKDRSVKMPGLVQVVVVGRAGTYSVPGTVTLQVALPPGVECYSTNFPGPPPAPACTLSGGKTLKCRSE